MSIQRLLLPGLGAALLLFTTAVQADEPFDSAVKHMLEERILPGYQAFEAATTEMQQAATALCENPDDASLKQARSAFQQTMDRWMEVAHLRTGPVEKELRQYRLHFWPDPRNRAQKQLAAALAAEDDERLSADNFPGISAGLQGLSALELLLFDAESPADFGSAKQPGYRCRFVQAISRNLHQIAGEINREWTTGKRPFRDQLMHPVPGQDPLESTRDVAAGLLGSLSENLQAQVSIRLQPPMGRSVQRARPKRVENWRSGRGLRNLRLSLQASRDLFATGYQPMLEASEAGRSLAESVQQAFHKSFVRLDAIPGSLPEAVTSETGREAVQQLIQALDELRQLVSAEVARTLDLPVGFNSLDGD